MHRTLSHAHLRVYAQHRTRIEATYKGKRVLKASLPAPKDPVHLRALAEIIEALGLWLEVRVDVVVYVSGSGCSFLRFLEDPAGLPLFGDWYECIGVFTDTRLRSTDEVQR